MNFFESQNKKENKVNVSSTGDTLEDLMNSLPEKMAITKMKGMVSNQRWICYDRVTSKTIATSDSVKNLLKKVINDLR